MKRAPHQFDMVDRGWNAIAKSLEHVNPEFGAYFPGMTIEEKRRVAGAAWIAMVRGAIGYLDYLDSQEIPK